MKRRWTQSIILRQKLILALWDSMWHKRKIWNFSVKNLSEKWITPNFLIPKKLNEVYQIPIESFIKSLIKSFIELSTESFVKYFIKSCSESFIKSFIESYNECFIELSIESCIESFTVSFNESWIKFNYETV